jgi:hypothetical protein
MITNDLPLRSSRTTNVELFIVGSRQAPRQRGIPQESKMRLKTIPAAEAAPNRDRPTQDVEGGSQQSNFGRCGEQHAGFSNCKPTHHECDGSPRSR